MRRLPVVLALVLATTLAGACARARRAPEVAPPPSAPVDTQMQRLLAEQRVRSVEDSIRRALAAPAAPPVEAPPVTLPSPTGTQPDPARPARRCVLDILNTPETRAQRIQDPVTKKYFLYVGGGVIGQCRGQDITIRGDSAESYEVNDLHILIGRVRYREPRYAIDADRVTYFRIEERLLFQGNVHAVMPGNGATLDGPQLEYFRPAVGLRDRARIVAVMRPKLTYVEKDSTGADQPPVDVYANTIIGEGDSTFHAVGQVRLERTDVLATGDSAVLDANHQFARLLKAPVIESKGDQPFVLKGRVIDLFGAARQVDRVVAIDSGNAVSADMNLTADTIDLRMRSNRLQRAFAFGTSGAYAVTPDRDIVADSLDIVMPDQRIRELRAVGKAYAESDPDTTKITSDERDWMRGDTLIAVFDSTVADTARPRLRELFASYEASAYYQVPADTTDRSRPGINYITGRVIRLTFVDGEVRDVSVTDQVSGVYLAPLADSVVSKPPVKRPPADRPRRLR